MRYALITESHGMPPGMPERDRIITAPMPYTLDGVEHKEEAWSKDDARAYYARMRGGAKPTTSMLPVSYYTALLDPILRERDVLFLCFSSAMSGTYRNIEEAMSALRAKYPERICELLDTASILGAHVQLVMGAMRLYDRGASLDDVANWVRDNRMRSRMFMTVSDPEHVMRSGRMSSGFAARGGSISLEAVSEMGKSGLVVPMRQIRGRKAALRALVDMAAASMAGSEERRVLVMHTALDEDAAMVADTVRRRVPGVTDVRIAGIGPVAGAHVGPYAMTVSCFGKERVV